MGEDDKKRYAYEMANYVPRSMQLGPPQNQPPHLQQMPALQGSSAANMHAAAAMAAAHAAAVAAASGGKRGRKRPKRFKDPNAPKRCMSAFFWYSQDARGKVRAANPDFGVGDIAKELGKRWADEPDNVR